MGRTLRVGTVAGAPVLVSAWWFVVAAVLTVVVAPYYRGWLPDLGGTGELLLGAVFVALLYASAFLHELGHAFAGRAFGLKVHSIQLTAIGGLTQMESPATPGRAAATSAAGPGVNIALGLGGVLALQLTTPQTLPHLFVGQVAVTNGLLAAINLLPGLPLDGGSILRAGIWKAVGRFGTATVVTAWCGRVIAVGLGGLALLGIMGGTTFVSPVWTALIALWMFSSASSALRTERVRERVPGLSARALARSSVVVRADEPVSVVVDRLAAAGATAAVVADSDGRLTGIVSSAAVAAVPLERRPWVDASTVARRLEPSLSLDADLGGEALLAALARTRATEYVVEDVGDGGARHLVGVLAFADVEAALQRR